MMNRIININNILVDVIELKYSFVPETSHPF
jgi:hypothetical protein